MMLHSATQCSFGNMSVGIFATNGNHHLFEKKNKILVFLRKNKSKYYSDAHLSNIDTSGKTIWFTVRTTHTGLQSISSKIVYY